jgi:hypothetical protein
MCSEEHDSALINEKTLQIINNPQTPCIRCQGIEQIAQRELGKYKVLNHHLQ